MKPPAGARLTVLLTGGTGFVGGQVARRLMESGHRVRALVRDLDSARNLEQLGVELVRGDITREGDLKGLGDDCSAVVHLVGIIRERPPRLTFEEVHTRGTLRVVDEAHRAGVKIFLHMSALGSRPEGTAYQRTKYEAEEVVSRSGVPFIIFRPSVIVGPGGGFIDMLLKVLRISPVTPIIGDGRYRLQPVDVEDVAEAFVRALGREDLRGRSFEIGGPHKLTYNRLIEIACEEFGLRRAKLHIPPSLVGPVVDLASNWRLPTPISSEELVMLLDESIVPGERNALRDVFGIEPTSFRATLQRFRRKRGLSRRKARLF